MVKFVIGFLFDYERENLILIRKTKPEWQKGSLNGVGGKVEPGEENLEAMIREFEEETGLFITKWTRFLTLKSGLKSDFEYTIELYKSFVDFRVLQDAKTTTEEEILLINIKDIPQYQRVLNLDWLVLLALDPIVIGGEIITT